MDDIPPQQNQSTDEYYGINNTEPNDKTVDATNAPLIAASFDEMME